MGAFDIVTGGVGLAGDAVNIGTGLVNLIGAKKRRKEQFAREDSAVQRRARDMEKAGLSKTLAAGSAAQSSDPIRPSASNISVGAGSDAASASQQRKHQAAQTALIDQQSRLIDQTIIDKQTENRYKNWLMSDKGAADIRNVNASTSNLGQDLENKKATYNAIIQSTEGQRLSNQEKAMMNEVLASDLLLFREYGQPYTKSPFTGGTSEILAKMAVGLTEG